TPPSASAQQAEQVSPSPVLDERTEAKRIDRAVRAFYNIPFGVNIIFKLGSLRPSEFRNYDEIAIYIEGNGKKQQYDFLLSKDWNSMIRITKMDLARNPYEETMKKINLEGRAFRGSKDARVIVVSYDDFQCPFCSRLHQTLFPELLKEYGDRVEFAYKD